MVGFKPKMNVEWYYGDYVLFAISSDKSDVLSVTMAIFIWITFLIV